MIYYIADRSATIGRGVSIKPFAVIQAGAVVEDNATIAEGAYIGPQVRIGAGAYISPHAVVLANVPTDTLVPPAVVWDEGSMQSAADVLPFEPEFPLPAKRGRPKKGAN